MNVENTVDFNPDRNTFILECKDMEFKPSGLNKDTDIILTKSIDKSEIIFMRYKDHLYSIDTNACIIKYEGDKSEVGSLYYGFSYLYELKKLLFKSKEGVSHAC